MYASNSTEPAVKTHTTRLPSLTGLRFFAALCVFLLHSLMLADPLKVTVPMSFFADSRIAEPLNTFVGKGGYIGVSFFFVLSGFVLTWSTRPGASSGAFLRRRLVKIFPNHLVMWVLAMALFAGAFTPVSTWLPNLFLTHAYFPQADRFTSVNPPSWTLCCELLFYVLFPLLIRPVRKAAENRLWLWAGVSVAGMVAVELVTKYVIPDSPRSTMLPIAVPQQWFGYIFPPMRLFEFVLGMFLARIVAAGRWPRAIGLAPATLLALAGYVWTIYVPSPYDFTLSMVIPISVLICAAATADIDGRRTVLNSRPMVWLGNISFGFYICQGVLLFHGRLWLVGDGTYSTPVAFALWIGFLALTLLFGAALYHGVEEPMMRRFSRSRKDRRLVAGGRPVPADRRENPTPEPAEQISAR
ncbi:acyltransferase [Streptomyces prunicolor]|uniref:acyltransferase family protein n=1 Tax=Streptomyces prunicolor TaxID=67348 RepID=UPI00225655E0|nr:acyltransferase [Streptomyces prunicolor]MCX5236663.1 acyltransferase [Streptomyces prunicolor]